MENYTKKVASYDLVDGKLALTYVQQLETPETRQDLLERYSSDLRWTNKEWRDGTLEFERRDKATIRIFSGEPIPARVERVTCIPTNIFIG